MLSGLAGSGHPDRPTYGVGARRRSCPCRRCRPSSSSACQRPGDDVRTISDFEERGELELTRATPVGPDLLLTSVHVGAIGLERAGDTTVNAVLLGANLPFVTPGRNAVAGVVGGGGFEWRTREGVSIFGATEAIGFSDQSTVWSAKGGIRVAF